MVVRGNRSKFDTGIDKEIDQRGFHLGLAGLEIVAADERLVLLGKLNCTRNKRILWRTIDERDAFLDTSDSKNSRWCNFIVANLDGGKKILSSVIDTGNDLCVTFGVGGPENDNLVEVLLCLEVTSRKQESALK